MGAVATALCMTAYLCTIFNTLHSVESTKDLSYRHKGLSEMLKRHRILQIHENDYEPEKDDILGKRQEFTFDDYGHMRFGKREESDDYGHMRFGRAGE